MFSHSPATGHLDPPTMESQSNRAVYTPFPSMTLELSVRFFFMLSLSPVTPPYLLPPIQSLPSLPLLPLLVQRVPPGHYPSVHLDISLVFGPGTHFAHHKSHICSIISALHTLTTFSKDFSSPLGDGELTESIFLTPHSILLEALHTTGAQAMPSGGENKRERKRGKR